MDSSSKIYEVSVSTPLPSQKGNKVRSTPGALCAPPFHAYVYARLAARLPADNHIYWWFSLAVDALTGFTHRVGSHARYKIHPNCSINEVDWQSRGSRPGAFLWRAHSTSFPLRCPPHGKARQACNPISGFLKH